MSDREAFEKWAKDNGVKCQSKFSNGEYYFGDAELAWKAWQAAKADTPPAVEVNQQLLEALEECRFALEPYDDVKPRDWSSDRERLRRTHQSVKAILAAQEVPSET